jgi:HK97 family phage portal protein
MNPFRSLARWALGRATSPAPGANRIVSGYLMPYKVPVTFSTAVKLSAFYAGACRIARALAQCPLRIYEERVDRDRKIQRTEVRHEIGYYLSTEPNVEMTAVKWREAAEMQAVFSGNSYTEVIRGQLSNRIVGLRLLDWRYMAPEYDTSGQLVFKYRNPGTGELVPFTPADILHIPGPGIGILGDDTMTVASTAIAAGLAAEEFGLAFMQNGASFGGFLEHPAIMNVDKKNELETHWQETHAGKNHAGATIVLDGGLKFVPNRPNVKEAQLLDLKASALADVCRIIDVPLVLMQHAPSAQGYGTNITQMYLQWCQSRLTPEALKWDQELTRKLFSKTGPRYVVQMDLEPLTSGDFATRVGTYATLVSSQLATINECRRREGWNTVPWGDTPSTTTAPSPPALPAPSLTEDVDLSDLEADNVDSSADE